MLNENAMLVSLSIRQPKQQRVDKRVTEKLCMSYGSAADAARVVKVLFDPASYKPIKQKINSIRAFHYDHTLPWLDSGQRILSSAGFMAYAEAMRKERAELTTLINDFVADYEEQLEQAKQRLNGMFKQEDYPASDEIRERFGFDVSYYPVPAAGDFRVQGIDEEMKQAIQEELDKAQQVAVKQAMRDVYDRLYKSVKHMTAKLSDPKAIFRDTLVDNLADLVELLPSLNIENDPKIDELRGDIVKAQLNAIDPEDLRKDKDFRKEVASDAKAIVDKMAAFMGA